MSYADTAKCSPFRRLSQETAMTFQAKVRYGSLVTACCLLAITAAEAADTRIEDFRATDISGRKLEIVVDYFYTGESGSSEVYIHASPVEADGSIDPGDFETEEKVLRSGGPHTEAFLIEGSREFTSVAINVCMSTLDDAILCVEFPYQKTWIVDDAEPAAPSLPGIASFNVDRSRISLGGSATLDWTAENTDVVMLGEPDAGSPAFLSRARTVPIQGSLVVSPTRTTTYVLQAQLGSNQTRGELTVEVVPAIELSFEVPDRTCVGRPYTVTWRTRHAAEVTLNGRAVPAEGSRNIRDHREVQTGTFNYRLSASNEFESVETTREIRVATCPADESGPG
jgi:hypothetical protein